ncbi:MAG: GNAT family N-acetyltransferase, partial [Candidatus Eremiobacteraeota bacterium]|nr:GNAT family N-acetyltransferase [Candidatus Eremiobacteraeota bacterium]
MPDVTIAAATGEDIRAVLRRRNVDDVTMRIALDLGERGTAWAARDESETIGLALAADYETERCVGDIFVEPSFRGQGIGARLLDAALAETGDRDRAVLTDGSNA